MIETPGRCNLLVVDDAPTNRAIIGAQLRRAGFTEIAFAEDGQQALSMIEARAPDLILLDILMPVLDGFETCKALRGDPRWTDLPILAMTGLEQPDERAHIFEAGATDLILKPIHAAELSARVTSHLQNRLLIRHLRSLNQRTDAEFAAARRMQESMLPNAAMLSEISERYGVSLASRFIPFTELAGDLWGVWPVDAYRFALFALDVSGHGMIAAINTFRIHTLLRRQRDLSGQPRAFLGSLNRLLCPMLSTGEFATMFYGIVNVATHEFRYAASGYTSPVLGDAGVNQLLDGSGLPLGITEAAQYETRCAEWGPGQSLILYSDALSEGRNAEGAILGEAGVRRLCAGALREPDAEAAAAKLEHATKCGVQSVDDLTLICVMR